MLEVLPLYHAPTTKGVKVGGCTCYTVQSRATAQLDATSINGSRTQTKYCTSHTQAVYKRVCFNDDHAPHKPVKNGEIFDRFPRPNRLTARRQILHTYLVTDTYREAAQSPVRLVFKKFFKAFFVSCRQSRRRIHTSMDRTFSAYETFAYL